MSRNEETSLASVKQGALQNAKGIWPVRSKAEIVVTHTHTAELPSTNTHGSAASTDTTNRKQLYKQSNSQHLSRTNKIEKKLNALRLRRSLRENYESNKE